MLGAQSFYLLEKIYLHLASIKTRKLTIWSSKLKSNIWIAAVQCHLIIYHRITTYPSIHAYCLRSPKRMILWLYTSSLHTKWYQWCKWDELADNKRGFSPQPVNDLIPSHTNTHILLCIHRHAYQNYRTSDPNKRRRWSSHLNAMQ